MIKIIYCIKRRPHLTRQQFQDYWRDHHAKLVWERARAIGMVKYVLNFTIDSRMGAACAASRGGAEPFSERRGAALRRGQAVRTADVRKT